MDGNNFADLFSDTNLIALPPVHLKTLATGNIFQLHASHATSTKRQIKQNIEGPNFIKWIGAKPWKDSRTAVISSVPRKNISSECEVMEAATLLSESLWFSPG